MKIYDKLIVTILFSSFLIASCEKEEPVPAYGIVPMYGVVPVNTISINKVSQPKTHLNNEKTAH